MHTINTTTNTTTTTSASISVARRTAKLAVVSIALAVGLTACGPSGPATVSVDLDPRPASPVPEALADDASPTDGPVDGAANQEDPIDGGSDDEGSDDEGDGGSGVDLVGTTDLAPVPTIPDPTPNPTTPADGAPSDLTSNQVPGEALDYGPVFGTPLAVVGVAHDDVLNFRIAPSPNAQIVTSHAPLHADLDMYALGEAWAAPSGVWWKVSVGGSEAWANQRYLGTLAGERDVFDAAAEYLQILMFEDTESAALAVAESFATTEPASRIEFAAPALNFDDGVGIATVDVLDIGDDSVKGWRLVIQVEIVWDEESGEPGAQDVAFVVLTAVDGSPICGRGADGLACL